MRRGGREPPFFMARVRTWPARTVGWDPGIASQNVYILARQLARQGLSDAGIAARLEEFHGDVSALQRGNAVRAARTWAEHMFGWEGMPGNPVINRDWMSRTGAIASGYRYTVIFYWGQAGQPGFEARTVVITSARNLRQGDIHQLAADVFSREAQRYERFRGFDPFQADYWQVLNAERRGPRE